MCNVYCVHVSKCKEPVSLILTFLLGGPRRSQRTLPLCECLHVFIPQASALPRSALEAEIAELHYQACIPATQ